MHRVKSHLERDLEKFTESVKSSDLDQIILRKSETKQLWNENANVYHYRYQRLRNHLNEQDFMLPQSPDFYPRFDKISKKYYYAPPTTNHYSHKPTFSSYMNTQYSGTEHTSMSLAQRSPSSIKIRNLKPPQLSLSTAPVIQQSSSTPTPVAQQSPQFTLPASPANSKAPKHSYFSSTSSFRKSESNLAQLYKQHTEFDKPIQKVINDESPSMFKEYSLLKSRIQRASRAPSGNIMYLESSNVNHVS